MSQNVDEHYGDAGTHLESAADHLEAARKASSDGDHKIAAYEAHRAHGHLIRAADHADLAAMAHLRHRHAHPDSVTAGNQKSPR
jgi:hypothetical protein